MRTTRGLAALALFAAVAAACSGGATPSPSASVAPSAPPPSAEPTAAPTPSPTPDACAVENLALKTAGTLTIGADNPAFPPYYQPSASNPPPWEFGDPTSGQGFEGAFAYALAEEMGFAKEAVAWVVTPFNNAIQPGPKDFDVYITQVSYSAERATAIDLSEGYYFNNQAIVAVKDTPIAGAKTIADLKAYKFAAQVGTTSLQTITDVIAPTTEAAVFDTNDAAIEALKNGQVDAIVVDLPTAFFIRDYPQVENAVIVGQFPAPAAGAEYFSVALDKDSALTPCVNGAIARLKESGRLDQIRSEWLAGTDAPVIQP
jgi:polar amino acid transport system substrate-binding protein